MLDFIILQKKLLKPSILFIDKRSDNLFKFFEMYHLKEVFVVWAACRIMDKKLKNIEVMKTIIVHLTLSVSLTLLGNSIPEILNIISSVVGPVGIEGGLSNINS